MCQVKKIEYSCEKSIEYYPFKIRWKIILEKKPKKKKETKKKI